MTMKTGCVALALGLLAANAHAAEWTRTVDLTKPDYASELVEGKLAATSEAFWIGSAFAFDPRSGLPQSPFALPERLSFDLGFTATSSQRGLLWKKNGGFGYSQGFPDADKNLWGSNYNAGSVTRVAPDGAQSRTWRGPDLGFAGYRVVAVDALKNVAGALVTLRPDAGGSAIVLRVDGQGRKLQQSAFATSCAGETAALDDLHGGHFEHCREPGPVNRFRRIGADPAQTWAEAVTFASPGTQVTEQGGLLHLPLLAGLDDAQYVDPSGQVRYRVAAYLGSAARSGAWFWSGAQQQLIRVNAAGHVIATAYVSGVQELVAHEDGGVLVRLFDEQSNFDDDYAIYDGRGRLVRRFMKQRVSNRAASRISFNGGQVLAAVQPALTATLIDDNGVAASVEFPHYQTTVRADAETLCVHEYEQVMSDPYDFFNPWWFVPRIRCADRNLDAPDAPGLGFSWVNPSRTAIVELVDVAAHVRVYSDGELLHFTKAGQLIHRVALTNALAIDLHPRQGVSVLARNAVGTPRTLRRYAMDGSMRFSRPLTVDQDASVFLAENGDTVLVTRVAPVHLMRFDGNGLLVGEREIGNEVAGLEAIDAEVTPFGVQLLMRAVATSPASPELVSTQALRTRLLVLSSDLAQVRASVALPGAWYGQAALWPATADDPRVALVGPTGLIVQQFDSRSGDRREKRVLPIGEVGAIRTGVSRLAFQSRYSQDRHMIDLDGRIRFLDHDKSLQRAVLRIHDSTSNPFSGAIGQRALAASWYAPNNTGQGLIVDLQNNATQLFSAWYAFAPEGGNSLAKQQWLSVQGDVGAARGSITLPIYRNSGGRFDLEGRTNAVPVGMADLVFTSCDRMEFWYRIGDESGALPMQRLTPRTMACDDGVRTQPPADTAPAIDLSGAWYDPARSGQGLAVSASGARLNQFLAGWFTYDVDNADDPDAQHWFTLQGASPNGYGQTVASEIFRTIGGSRAGEPTRNTNKVGTALLTVHDCATATLEYIFDDTPVAGAFADRTRAISLKRLGRCTN